MEKSAIKVLMLLLFLAGQVIVMANDKSISTLNDPELDEEAIIKRIEEMTSDVVPPKYDEVVKSYLKTYTIKKRGSSSQILGNQVVYFPLFEQKLKENGLPTDLKYLSVVESALNPNAVSRVGATGLWQFMEATGKYFGLEVNNVVDERRDPTRSTEAAIIYLSKLYKRFNNWELAIAAYNSGEGRVARAVKRSRSRNFWRLRRFLPRETRNYVPAFVAATYLLKYHKEHEIEPDYPALDIQLSETTSVYDSITFYEIAQITALPLDIIEQLNPGFVQGIIPAKEEGYYLTLPKRVMPAFLDYLDEKRPDYEARLRSIQSTPVYVTQLESEDEENYEATEYVVLTGELLPDIAKKLGCSVHQLKAWNKLTSDELMLGQTLIAYVPKEVKKFQLFDYVPVLDRINIRLLPMHIASITPKAESIRKQIVESDGYLCYRLDEQESVFSVSNKLPFINFSILCNLNGIRRDKLLPEGTLLKVKQLPAGGR